MRNGYGKQHREEREKKLEQMPTPQCEITGKRHDLAAHHVVPRLFSGPDLQENYIILYRAFHEYLHAVCNAKDSKLVGRRIHLANFIKKHIRDKEKTKIAKAQIAEIDEILMEEYVTNLIDKVGEEFKEMLVLTVMSNFRTIRVLAIENEELKAENEDLQSRINFKK